MKRFIYMAERKNVGWVPLLMMGIAVFSLPGNASDVLFRDVSVDNVDNVRAVAAIEELTRFYDGSPGFKYAKVITIDTALLEGKSKTVKKREERENRDPVSGLTGHNGAKEHLNVRIVEWRGTIPEMSENMELTKINGKFYGSYYEKDSYRVITPFRSGGQWMTVMLIYDGQFPRCGMEPHADKNDGEIEE